MCLNNEIELRKEQKEDVGAAEDNSDIEVIVEMDGAEPIEILLPSYLNLRSFHCDSCPMEFQDEESLQEHTKEHDASEVSYHLMV